MGHGQEGDDPVFVVEVKVVVCDVLENVVMMSSAEQSSQLDRTP